jgi:nitroimidazol reductase NimA-like FMN-containing flavoprotein (pyridoxamine 5'-phosphate oxidase superfamily)
MMTREAQTVLQTDPAAQTLLQSTIPARLAYIWRDGTPRVVPLWFHWTGEELLMGAPRTHPR